MKLNLNQFNEFKQKMQKFIEQASIVVQQNQDNPNFDENMYEQQALSSYFNFQSQLLSYDLSEIPFEAWENLYIFSDEKHRADFSKSKANLDFEIINLDIDKFVNFKNCNIKNPQKIPVSLLRTDCFNNIDMSKIIENTPLNKYLNIFDNNELLLFIETFGYDNLIKCDNDFFDYLKENKKNQFLTVNEAKNLTYQYFLKSKKTKILSLLKHLNIETLETNYLNQTLTNLLKIRPELNLTNPVLTTTELLSPKIVNTYGYNIISTILEYNSGADKVLINATKNNDNLLKNWIDYIIKLPIYDKKFLHMSLLNYENTKSLIKDILDNNISLNDKQQNNLLEILSKKNTFNVSNVNDLTNYRQYRQNLLKEKINSNTLEEVKNNILKILFNTNLLEAIKIFKEYNIDSNNFLTNIIEKKNILSIEDIASIEIVKEIINENNIDSLRLKFNDIIKLGQINTSFFDITNKLKNYYGSLLKNSLFKPDFNHKKGIKYSTIFGVDSDLLDINNQIISKNSPINVLELDGIDFKLLIHNVDSFNIHNNGIINNPALFNKLEGSSTLSTSMISNTHMNCVGNGRKNAVYYGFNDISDKSLYLMDSCDTGIEFDKRLLNPSSFSNHYMIPDVLQSESENYNEVVLDRKSSEKANFDHRLQPNCIICFDGNISDQSKLAAQYFNIPIYVINRQKYTKKNQNLKEHYQTKELISFNKNDVHNILYSKGDLKEKYNLFLKLLEQSFNNNLIDINEYQELINEAITIISSYGIKGDDIDLTILTNKLNNTLKEEMLINGPTK